MPRLAKPHSNVLASSRVLVFGGTSGLGAAITSAAAFNGANVFVSSSNEANIAAAVKHLQTTYPDTKISGAVADLANNDTIEANIKSVLDAAIKEFGGPLDHIAVTSGDAMLRGTLGTIQAHEVFKGWGVRYVAPLMIGKLVAGNPGIYLKQSTASSITFTSGILNHRPTKGVGAVPTVGGAVESLSRSFALQLAPIRVNTVAPGAFATELLDSYGEAGKAFADVSILKELGKPEEAAEAYLFCMRCSFYTSQELIVDGGFLYA